MNSNFLARAWSELAPSIGNHLWQSTLFVAVVALLVLAFRSNRAGTRYGLWFAASLKFLIPFSLLINLGSYLSSFRSPYGSSSLASMTIVQLNQPFNSQSAALVAHSSVATAGSLPALSRFAPWLLVVWLAGTLAVLAVWLVRWYRISAIAKRATPLREGAEAEIVARLQAGDSLRRKVEIVSTTEAIEPGIFGIARPVLLWPAAMRGQVSEAHIETIVAHELCHVRRRDNLSAMLHMLVEALFWFHPFVWWIGGRLVEDRERACDEAVVDSGRERRVYAESILKVCEVCVESPLPCVPGVSGADLRQRIAQIMSYRVARPIGLGRKLLIIAACCLAITAPIVSGALRGSSGVPLRTHVKLVASPDPIVSFAEVTIKSDPEATAKLRSNSGPIVSRVGWNKGELNAKGAPLLSLIMLTYAPIEMEQITGGPDWIKTEIFDIHAKGSAAVLAAWPKMSKEERNAVDRSMLQNLLTDHFGLKFHRESKVNPIYTLVVDDPAKLKPIDGDCPPHSPGAPEPTVDPAKGPPPCGTMFVMPGELRANRVEIPSLLRFLSINSGRFVEDKTNLTGRYDVNLKFMPDTNLVKLQPPSVSGLTVDANAPSLFDALVEQVGLRLVPQTGPLEMLVVDDATMPAETSAEK
jgi:bla regulator protein blaR1